MSPLLGHNVISLPAYHEKFTCQFPCINLLVKEGKIFFYKTDSLSVRCGYAHACTCVLVCLESGGIGREMFIGENNFTEPVAFFEGGKGDSKLVCFANRSKTFLRVT